MMFRRIYSEEQRGFRPLRVPLNIRLTKLHKRSIYRKTSVLPSHIGALNRRQRAQAQGSVRSIIGSALSREVCTRSHITAPESHGASKLVMVARAMQTSRANEASARSCPMGLSTLRSIAAVHLSALAGAKSSLFALFTIV